MKSRYPKIVMWWRDSNSVTEMTLHDRTVAEARAIAVGMGYKAPKWYMPWQYFTGGLGLLTVGFAY